MAPVPTNQAMQVNDQAVKVTKIDGQDYICLTDMAKSFGAERAVESWLRNKNTVEFLGVWERFYNQDFDTRIDKLTEMARKQYASIILENDAIKELQ